MKFSVLMTMYRRDNVDWFVSAISSVFNQTLPPDEVVLVEDGPITEELAAIVSEFKSRFTDTLKVVQLPENVGQGRALNVGIQHCTYEFIARMDSDDISRPDRFRQQIEMMKENQYDIISAWVSDFMDNPDEPIGIRQVPEGSQAIRRFAKRRSPFNHVAVMFRKEAVLAAGGYSGVVQCQDYDLWARMLCRNVRCRNSKSILVDVRISDNFKRKAGVAYFKEEIAIQHALLNYGITNRLDYLLNILTKALIRLIPPHFMSRIYTTFLRSNG
ncbi:MAG: glycosyltransferase [Mobilitalea sp.]